MAKKINAAVASAIQASMFNASTWTPKGEVITLKEAWEDAFPGMYSKITEAKVTSTSFADGSVAKRITVFLNNGSNIELKLSGLSDLTEGDVVDPATIKGQMLEKMNSKDIFRWDAELA